MTSPARGDDEKPADEKRPVPLISSEALFAGHREIIIQHGREQYRLRLTSTNKLILNK